LPPAVLEQLGYITAAKPQTTAVAPWARQAVAKVAAPQFKSLQAKLSQAWRAGFVSKMQLSLGNYGLLGAGAIILILTYSFICNCCRLICQKTGYKPGVLVWLPVLQVLPMLRAASMSAWWFIAFVIPGINLVGYILWCVKIVQARNKTTPLMILLLCPVINLLALAYLAYSEDAAGKTEKLHLETMTLESA
jgi:hypothetical protein